MKCLARKKNTLTKNQKIKAVLSYSIAATSEILLKDFNFSQDKVIDFSRYVSSKFDLCLTPLLSIKSYDPKENFDYTINPSSMTWALYPFSHELRVYIVALLNLIIFSLLDDFDFSHKDCDAFIEHFTHYIFNFASGKWNTSEIVDRIADKYDFHLKIKEKNDEK